MADKRNRISDVVDYIESLDITVNIGKNKARGNKGFFSSNNNCFRIDISNKINEDTILSTLLHEFAHYIHYKFDRSLKSLDPILGNLTDTELDELMEITVDSIPKELVNSLFGEKENLLKENNMLAKNIKSKIPEFKLSNEYPKIEKELGKIERLFLKYEKIKYNNKIYSIDNIENDFPHLTDLQIFYIKLKLNQKKISKINSKINRLNRYYTQPTELWARYFETFCTNYLLAESTAPNVTSKLKKIINENKIPEITNLCEILM